MSSLCFRSPALTQKHKAAQRTVIGKGGSFKVTTIRLFVRRHSLERYGRRSFSCAGPTLLNAMPEDLRLEQCMNTFKYRLKL